MQILKETEENIFIVVYFVAVTISLFLCTIKCYASLKPDIWYAKTHPSTPHILNLWNYLQILFHSSLTD